MGNNEHLTVGEYERGMKAVERQIALGFDRMDKRFDRVEQVQDEHLARLVVLEAAPAQSQKKAYAWSSVIATLVVGLIEGVRSIAR